MDILEYKNIIVGGGLAGISCAIELLDNNKQVLIIERDIEKHFGGLAKKSFGGILFSGTPQQKRAGIKDIIMCYKNEKDLPTLFALNIFPRSEGVRCHVQRRHERHWAFQRFH